MNDHEGDAPGDRYVALVLSCVEQVPAGRVTTYGAVAALLRDLVEAGGPRQVARAMALEGAAVPWWRCVRADGTLPGHLQARAQPHWAWEGTPVRAAGVAMREAFVEPTPPPECVLAST